MCLTSLGLYCLASSSLAQPSEYEFSAPRVLAFGDVHGAYDTLLELLRNNNVVNDKQNWTAGDAHLVSLGDLVDRGPDSRKVMDFLRRLQPQAAAAGGRVHVILGNHEVMNLVGDLRSVAAQEILAFAPHGEPLPTSPAKLLTTLPGYAEHRRAFRADGEYGQWLLSLPVVIKINNDLFVHGGLSASVAKLGLTKINQRVKATIRRAIATGEDTPAQDSLLGDLGPLWYRGTASCHQLIESTVLDTALADLGAERVVVGHTPTPTRAILQRANGRVLAIDTGMLGPIYKGRPFLLEITGDTTQARSMAGEVTAPAEFHSVLWSTPTEERSIAARLPQTLGAERDPASKRLQLTDASGENYLVDFTTTKPERARRAEALWRLDRLLGIDMVPLTLARQVNGKWGYLSFVRGNWLSERERAALKQERTEFCYPDSTLSIAVIFDALTRQGKRSAWTLWYRKGTWDLRLGDEAATFPKGYRLPPIDKATVMPPLLEQRLRALTIEDLSEHLGELLSSRELVAILMRRDKLLTLLGNAGP